MNGTDRGQHVLELMGRRQQDVLKLLLQNKAGLSLDQLAALLEITRTAVRQHVTALELDGYVSRGDARKTAGRPGQAYVLTEKGSALFPKQYTWFSGLLLETLKAERGSEGLAQWLRGIAATIARGLQPRLEGLDEPARLAEVVRIMDELAFEAALREGSLEASNCIYHDLARKFPEVCQFDLELLAGLTGGDVHQTECIVRGGGVCRFKLQREAL